MTQCTLPSPVPGSSGSTGNIRPSDAETESPRKTRRIHGRKHKTRVRDVPVHAPSTVREVQDVQELAGAVVYDCRHSFCRSR